MAASLTFMKALQHLLPSFISKGIIDGVTSSSAVVAHEMGGVLDEVKRVDGVELGFDAW